MQCPACNHSASAVDFGNPAKCPDCGAFYDKALIARAKRNELAASARPEKKGDSWIAKGLAGAKEGINQGRERRRNEDGDRRQKGYSVWFVAIGSVAVVLYLSAGRSERTPPSWPAIASQSKPHLAPVELGAIPDRIGCDEGCDKLNLFERWQPFLVSVVEVQRRQEKCKKVEYVSVSHESDPQNPKFFVGCENAKGDLYNTFYTKAQVDAQIVARGDDVDRQYAIRVCDKELPRHFSGFSSELDIKRGFYTSANGRARVTYDLELSGRKRIANCLVDHDFVEFVVVQ